MGYPLRSVGSRHDDFDASTLIEQPEAALISINPTRTGLDRCEGLGVTAAEKDLRRDFDPACTTGVWTRLLALCTVRRLANKLHTGLSLA